MGTSKRARKRRPTIGLALGSGSAGGLAHIGIIRAIEEAGIPIDMVAGTSIGSLVGAVYASGRLDTLEQAFLTFDWKRIRSFFDPVFPRSGLINGIKTARFIRSHVPATSFDQLRIPFCAVATNLANGEEVRICDGDLIEAVRASISVPGIFTPVRHKSRVLVDGGLVDPVPVSAVRVLGADFVIAVDLNHEIVTGKARRRKTDRAGKAGKRYARAASRIADRLRASKHPGLTRVRTWLDKEPLPSMFEVLLATLQIMQVRISESRLQIDRPEILIRPPLSSIHPLEFDRAAELIDIGYRSAIGPIRELGRRLGELHQGS